MAKKAQNTSEAPRNGHSAPPSGQNGSSSAPGPDLPYSVKDLTDDQVKNAFREMNEFIHNRDWTRAKTFASLFDKRRNLEKECGYPEWGEETTDDYQKLYDREAVARRVVEVMPKESWQVSPEIYEDENIEVTTPFERSIQEFNKQVGGGTDNHHVDASGSYLKEKLYELDIKAGIGSFGILLFGLDDVSTPDDLRKPVQGWVEDPPSDLSPPFISAGRQVLFMRVFSASHVEVNEVETDPTSTRYGLPLLYTVDFEQGSHKVHWQRVLHVDSESGAPRMQPVLNRLLDLRKVYACSAEMYWLAAFMGIFFKVQDKALELSNGRPTLDVAEMRNQLENFFNSLQRYLQLTGLEPVPMYTNTLSDPQGQVQVLMEAICVEVGIPKRIFTGSERGELASSQDDEKWNERVKQRQNTFLTPKVVIPCINRLIKYGVLQPPGETGFVVEWPDMTAQTDLEHADIVFKTTQAMSGYMKAGVRQLMPEFEFLTLILGLSEKEALNVVAKGMKVREEEDAKRKEEEKRIAKLGGSLPKPKLKLAEGELENQESQENTDTPTPLQNVYPLAVPIDLTPRKKKTSSTKLLKRLIRALENNHRSQVQNQQVLAPPPPYSFELDSMTVHAEQVVLRIDKLEVPVQTEVNLNPTIAPNNYFQPNLVLPEMAPVILPSEVKVPIQVNPTPFQIIAQAYPAVIEKVVVDATVQLPPREPKKVVIEGPGGETYEGKVE